MCEMVTVPRSDWATSEAKEMVDEPWWKKYICVKKTNDIEPLINAHFYAKTQNQILYAASR